jgi:hypothetical protein
VEFQESPQAKAHHHDLIRRLAIYYSLGNQGQQLSYHRFCLSSLRIQPHLGCGGPEFDGQSNVENVFWSAGRPFAPTSSLGLVNTHEGEALADESDDRAWLELRGLEGIVVTAIRGALKNIAGKLLVAGLAAAGLATGGIGILVLGMMLEWVGTNAIEKGIDALFDKAGGAAFLTKKLQALSNPGIVQ